MHWLPQTWHRSPYYYLNDNLGSVRKMTSGTGNTTYADNDFFPWGTEIVHETAAPFKFAGYEYDNASTYNYANYRFQSGNLGRFFSPDRIPGDPGNPQSWNRYAYVLNNPTNLIDPLGLDCEGGQSDFLPHEPGNISVTHSEPCPYGTYNPCDYAVCVQPGVIGTNWYDPPPMPVVVRNNLPNIAVAANNWTPWYKNSCIQKALLKGAATTALDAIGLLPEGGAVSATFSLFHGAAGISNGTKILERAQFGAAIISTANAGSDVSGDSGAFSVAGAQAITGIALLGAGLAKATPIVGQVLSGLAVAEDLYGTYKAVAGCHP